MEEKKVIKKKTKTKKDVEKTSTNKKDIEKKETKVEIQKKGRFPKVAIIIFILDLLLTGILTYNLITLDIIPVIYIILAVGALLVLSSIFFIFSQRKARKVPKIIGYVLTVLVLIINIIGIYYLSATNGFLAKFFKEGKDSYIVTYYVLVKDNDFYKKIDDINGTNVGYFKTTPNIDKALETLNKKINFKKLEFENVLEPFKALDDEYIMSILTEKNLYDSLLESNKELNEKNYKVLYSFDIHIEEEVSKKEVKGESFNVYIGGPDFTNTNYDFNMIATINKTTNKILLTSTPRDYYVPIAGKGMKDILGYAGVWGINTSIKTIENLYTVDMNYFVKINTSSLVGLVDTLGGVQFCNKFNGFTTTHAQVQGTYDDKTGQKLYVASGCKKYNGIQILTIARERKAFPSGDRQRQKNCQEIMISIFKEMASFSSLTKFNQVLDSVSELYTTNLPKEEVTNMAKSMLEGKKWEFVQQSVTGSDSSNYVHLGTVKDYVMIPNQDSLNSAISKIKEVMDEA